MKFKYVAVISAGSRFHVLNGDPARASVLCVIVRREDLKFTDHVWGLGKVVNRARQTLRSGRVEQSDAIKHGDPSLRLTAIDMRPGDVTAAPDHPGKNGSEIGGRTHGAGNQQRNILDNLRIYTAAKFRVFVVQRGGIGSDVHTLGGRLEGELHVLANGIADSHKNAVLRVLSETRGSDGELIRAGQDVTE